MERNTGLQLKPCCTSRDKINKNVIASSKSFDKFSWIFSFLLNSLFCCEWVGKDTIALPGGIDCKLREFGLIHSNGIYKQFWFALPRWLRMMITFQISDPLCHIFREIYIQFFHWLINLWNYLLFWCLILTGFNIYRILKSYLIYDGQGLSPGYIACFFFPSGISRGGLYNFQCLLKCIISLSSSFMIEVFYLLG